MFSEDQSNKAVLQGASSIREGLINQRNGLESGIAEIVSDAESSSEESEGVLEQEGLERRNKPVSRLNKLTRTERNAKLIRKLRNDAQEE